MMWWWWAAAMPDARLLVLPRDFEQPEDAMHVFRGERQISPEGSTQHLVHIGAWPERERSQSSTKPAL